MCKNKNRVKQAELGGDSLGVVSAAAGVMVFSFKRSDIEQEFDTSQLLSIICRNGEEEQFEVYIGRPSKEGPRGLEDDAGPQGLGDHRAQPDRPATMARRAQWAPAASTACVATRPAPRA